MPEQKPQSAAFDPANFALPTSDQPTLCCTQYTVVANSDHAELSYYTQHLYQIPDAAQRPGGTFSDQSEAGQPQANSYQEQGYRPSFAPPPQAAARPTAPGGTSLHFSDQSIARQSINNKSVTDGSNRFQRTDNYANGEAQSFAPSANRSSIPYVPRTDVPPKQKTKLQSQQPIENLAVSTSQKPNMILVGQESQGPRANQTKLVDLRHKQTQSETPARDQNTVATARPEFLDRKAFSNKFSVTPAKSSELTYRSETNQKSSPKIIYLKSVGKEEQPAAQLVEPTFEPAPAEPVSAEPAPVEPVAVESVAVKPTPFEPAPFEPAPFEPAPFEPAPFEPAPFEPAPFEPAPFKPVAPEFSEDSPIEQAPVAVKSPFAEAPASIEAGSPLTDALATPATASPFGDAPADPVQVSPFSDAPAAPTQVSPFSDAPAAPAQVSPFGDVPTAPAQASPFSDAPTTDGVSPLSDVLPDVSLFRDTREIDKPTKNVLVIREAPQEIEAPQDFAAPPAPSFAASTPFQPATPPAPPTANSTAPASEGFTDSDFFTNEKSNDVKQHANDIAQSGSFSPKEYNSRPASKVSQKDPFRVAKFRSSVTNEEAALSDNTSEAVTHNVASHQTQIAPPRLEVNSYRTANTVNQQLITATTLAPQPASPPAEMGWLSPWWMLVVMVPLAMYLATTRLFRDEEWGWEENPDAPIFGSDYGIPGGSKSDVIYGTDAEFPTADYLQLDEEFRKAHAAIPFAEPVFFDLPSVEEINNPQSAQELSQENSPNFGAGQKTKRTRQKKKHPNRKARERKAS